MCPAQGWALGVHQRPSLTLLRPSGSLSYHLGLDVSPGALSTLASSPLLLEPVQPDCEDVCAFLPAELSQVRKAIQWMAGRDQFTGEMVSMPFTTPHSNADNNFRLW